MLHGLAAKARSASVTSDPQRATERAFEATAGTPFAADEERLKTWRLVGELARDAASREISEVWPRAGLQGGLSLPWR